VIFDPKKPNKYRVLKTSGRNNINSIRYGKAELVYVDVAEGAY
jgi:hypothetical protein